MPSPYRKGKDRNGLMNVFITDYMSQYECVCGQQAKRAQKTSISVSQLTHERKDTSEPSGIVNRTALASHRSRVAETRRHMQRCAVKNSMALGISQGNAPTSLKRETEHLTRQVEKTRPSLRNTRVHPTGSLQTKIHEQPDARLRIQENVDEA